MQEFAALKRVGYPILLEMDESVSVLLFFQSEDIFLFLCV
jgi:hypothetical protein